MEEPVSISAEDPECKKSEDTKKFKQRRWASKNVYGVGFSMVMIFAAFSGLQNLQSTINATDGLGVISLSVLYGMFVLVGPLTPMILRMLGTKYSLLVGYVCHLIYTLANFYPSWYTLIPGSVMIGLASGPIWAATGSHLSEIAITTCANLHKDQSFLISKYTAIFFFLFQLSHVPGNLASSLILYPYESNSSLPANGTCNYLSESMFQVSYLFYILVATYCIFNVFGIVIVLLSVDKLQMIRYYAEDRHDSWLNMYLKLPLKEIISVFTSWKMIMLTPITLYTGLEMGFSFGTFTRVYISDCLGTHHVGFALMTLGVSSGFLSLIGSIIIKCVPRWVIILFGAAMHLSIFLGLGLWYREPSLYAVYVGAMMWGFGNAVWNMVGTSLAGILFPKMLESAFSVLRMWLALGFMLSFLAADYVTLTVQIWSTLGILVFSVCCTLLIELLIAPEQQSCCCFKSSKVEDVESKHEDKATSTGDIAPYHGSAIFEACGSIVLSEITMSWLYRINGNPSSSETSSSDSSSSATQPEQPTPARPLYKTKQVQCNTTEQERCSKPRKAVHRQPSPAYSHKSEIFERDSSRQSAMSAHHSAPSLFAQYNGRTLSDLTTSFVSTVIQTNKKEKSPAASPRADKGSGSSETRNSLFEEYRCGENLENMSSTFIHATEHDGTLSNVSSNAFQEYESEGVIKLTTSFIDSTSEAINKTGREPSQQAPSEQEFNGYTCDSIDGTQPQSHAYSFSAYLRSRRLSQQSGMTSQLAQSNTGVAAHVGCASSHTTSARATSAPASSSRSMRSYLKGTTESTSSKLDSEEQREKQKDEKDQNLEEKHSVATGKSTVSLPMEEIEHSSRSDIIFVGPGPDYSDTDDSESIWTSVSLTRYSI